MSESPGMRRTVGRNGAERAPQRSPSTVSGRMAMCLLMAMGVMMGVSGCRSSDEKLIELSPPMVEQALSLSSIKALVSERARRWVTLKADCELVIRDARIQLPGNQALFRNGKLFIRKTDRGGQIHLTCPGPRGTGIEMVGDGRSYAVNMSALRTQYSGRYGDTPPGRQEGIFIMPDDIVDAFDLTGVFAGKMLTYAQGPMFSTVHGMVPVTAAGTDAVTGIRMVNSVTVDRRGGRVRAYDKYNPDGTLRVSMRIAGYKPFRASDNTSAEVPTSVWMGCGGTAVMLRLRAVTLNEELDPNLFTVRR